MSAPRPHFLARRHYRQRRLRDAARLLPVLGLFLLLLPMLLDKVPVSARFLYLFGVWLVLILAAAALSPHLQSAEAAEPPPGEPGEAPDEGDEARASAEVPGPR